MPRHLGGCAPPLLLLAFALACTLLPRAAADVYYVDVTLDGCPCLTSCQKTFDSLGSPWCYTSDRVELTNKTMGCGSYSVARQRFWGECTTVVNSTAAGEVAALTTFSGVWITVTAATTAATAAAYMLAGCLSIVFVRKRSMLWFPVVSTLMGGCHGFCFGACFAVAIAFMYLSIPYALDLYTAVALGIGMSVLLLYGSLGRQFVPGVSPHVSEYAD